jgi:hypothetical protein
VNRWYTCDITAGRDVTIGKIFDEVAAATPVTAGPGSRWSTGISASSAYGVIFRQGSVQGLV